MTSATAYFLLPLDGALDQHTVIVLVLGMLVTDTLLALQAVGIVRSPYPRLRTVETLGTAVPLFLLLLSAT
ncbi:hypothetical protein ACFWUT_25525 [Streptomyces cyaneofuscatus]|uniref:hypothetical protein n=1 Tax=Streptomyces cyaneofuscatus TaxID=66883 RepID=UPI003669D204